MFNRKNYAAGKYQRGWHSRDPNRAKLKVPVWVLDYDNDWQSSGGGRRKKRKGNSNPNNVSPIVNMTLDCGSQAIAVDFTGTTTDREDMLEIFINVTAENDVPTTVLQGIPTSPTLIQRSTTGDAQTVFVVVTIRDIASGYSANFEQTFDWLSCDGTIIPPCDGATLEFVSQTAGQFILSASQGGNSLSVQQGVLVINYTDNNGVTVALDYSVDGVNSVQGSVSLPISSIGNMITVNVSDPVPVGDDFTITATMTFLNDDLSPCGTVQSTMFQTDFQGNVSQGPSCTGSSIQFTGQDPLDGNRLQFTLDAGSNSDAVVFASINIGYTDNNGIRRFLDYSINGTSASNGFVTLPVADVTPGFVAEIILPQDYTGTNIELSAAASLLLDDNSTCGNDVSTGLFDIPYTSQGPSCTGSSIQFTGQDPLDGNRLQFTLDAGSNSDAVVFASINIGYTDNNGIRRFLDYSINGTSASNGFVTLPVADVTPGFVAEIILPQDYTGTNIELSAAASLLLDDNSTCGNDVSTGLFDIPYTVTIRNCFLETNLTAIDDNTFRIDIPTDFSTTTVALANIQVTSRTTGQVVPFQYGEDGTTFLDSLFTSLPIDVTTNYFRIDPTLPAGTYDVTIELVEGAPGGNVCETRTEPFLKTEQSRAFEPCGLDKTGEITVTYDNIRDEFIVRNTENLTGPYTYFIVDAAFPVADQVPILTDWQQFGGSGFNPETSITQNHGGGNESTLFKLPNTAPNNPIVPVGANFTWDVDKVSIDSNFLQIISPILTIGQTVVSLHTITLDASQNSVGQAPLRFKWDLTAGNAVTRFTDLSTSVTVDEEFSPLLEIQVVTITNISVPIFGDFFGLLPDPNVNVTLTVIGADGDLQTISTSFDVEDGVTGQTTSSNQITDGQGDPLPSAELARFYALGVETPCGRQTIVWDQVINTDEGCPADYTLNQTSTNLDDNLFGLQSITDPNDTPVLGALVRVLDREGRQVPFEVSYDSGATYTTVSETTSPDRFTISINEPNAILLRKPSALPGGTYYVELDKFNDNSFTICGQAIRTMQFETFG